MGKVTLAEEKRMSIGSGSFCIVAGLGAIAYFGWCAYLQSVAVSWPKTPARIVTSQVVMDGDSFLANIVFEYSVEGVTHRSTELWFNSAPAGKKEDMQKMVAEYPRGSSIEVFYNPADTSQGVVDPQKFATLNKSAVVFGFFGVLIGGFFLWSGLTAKPDESYVDGDFLLDPAEVRASASKRKSEAPAITWVSKSASETKAAAPSKPKGPRHWAVRAIAGLVGVPVLFLFGGAALMILQQGFGPEAKHPLPVIVISTVFCGGIALVGLWLSAVCFVRRGKHTQAA